MVEKIKRKHQQTEFMENSAMLNDPPSPMARHVKWKMTRTKRYGQMTSTSAQQVSNKIMS